MKKTYLFFCLFFFLTSCDLSFNNETIPCPAIKTPTYNLEKDVYLNRVLDTKLIKFINEELFSLYTYELWYSEIHIKVMHFKQKDFERKESWYFLYTRIDGVEELIDPHNLVADNRVSNNTILRIRAIIKENDK